MRVVIPSEARDLLFPWFLSKPADLLFRSRSPSAPNIVIPSAAEGPAFRFRFLCVLCASVAKS
jgi:hypothetical protein